LGSGENTFLPGAAIAVIHCGIMLNRRDFLAVCSQFGLAGTLFPGVLYAQATEAAKAATNNLAIPAHFPAITAAMIQQAADIAGVVIPPGDVPMMLDTLTQMRHGYRAVRALDMPNSVAPAYIFDPLPKGASVDSTRKPVVYAKAPIVGRAPANLEDLAFSTVGELAAYIRTQKVSSLALTEMYIARLKRYDPELHFLITLTEERALAQARAADAEIAAGKYRGPLHGMPWGAKDLLAVKGYPTTWGAGGFEHQMIDEDATVVKRLDAAGAVLIAKLTLGALASGDKWFGGRTRNPWNPKQGSSGSSAGPASATAAGCVAFSIGSETLGSISSPSTRCGVSGLRPTFGFVPRTGAMALAWTMDKLGPICRSVDDCAMVLDSIYGPDGQDLSVRDAAFNWNADFDWRSLRVGYIESAFLTPKPVSDTPPPGMAGEALTKWQARLAHRRASRDRTAYDRGFDRATLDKLRSMGVKLTPLELPKLPYDDMANLLNAEAAAAFDHLTMTGRDRLLTEQGPEDWPNLFRVARFYPAVEYIQANRARSLAIAGMAKLFAQVDVIVVPSSTEQLTVTNLTGHPAVIVPNGLRGSDAPPPAKTDTGDEDNIGGPGTPVSITFLGNLYQDAKLCAFARAYQWATDFYKMHPVLQPPAGK
jgi:Asp-tRNA(Asn)/Glu-tRNA(Gln) amidotransferase A subunit family amidase